MPTKFIIASLSVISTLSLAGISLSLFKTPVKHQPKVVVSRVVSDPMLCDVAKLNEYYSSDIYCK
jgi:hypothetical protein